MIVALTLKSVVPSRASRHGSPDEQGRYGSPGKQIRFWLITDILCIPRPNDLPRQPLGLFCAGFCDRESIGAPFVQDFCDRESLQRLKKGRAWLS